MHPIHEAPRARTGRPAPARRALCLAATLAALGTLIASPGCGRKKPATPPAAADAGASTPAAAPAAGAAADGGVARLASLPTAPPKLVATSLKETSTAFGEVEALAKDQKYEEATKRLEVILAEARKRGHEPDWVRALIDMVQLRQGLHGYETAVRLMREQSWPDGALGRLALELYYAQALVTYARNYSWEINKREKVDTRGVVDLKAWTREEIYREAAQAFLRAYQVRQVLGDLPLTSIDQFLVSGSYPASIRGTLRDVVSYLFVEQLVDTNGWRPEQQNDLFQLKLDALIAGARGSKELAPLTDAQLVDPAVHPLLRAGAILDDLEGWHEGRQSREAALETRIERGRRLLSAFTKDADKDRIREALLKHLETVASLPWSSIGTCVVAESLRSSGQQVRARELAQKAAAAHPNGPGVSPCTQLVKQIEHWDYEMQGSRSDGLDRRSVEITHRNLPELFFRAYPVDLQARLARARDYNLLPAYSEIEKLLDGRPDLAWSVRLPATPDYNMHRTYVTPPLKKPGAYIIVASATAKFERASGNKLRAMHLNAGDLVLLVRHQQGKTGFLEATAVSGKSGAPIAGAEVVLYRYDWQKGHQPVATVRSGADGIAQLGKNLSSGSHFLYARQGAHVALDPTYRSHYAYESGPGVSGAFLYTDRSIYRPDQRLHWKVVAYSGDRDTGQFKVTPGATLTIHLQDPNRQTVESKSVTTNEFGTAAGEFVIPRGRLLGSWIVTSNTSGGTTSVKVEEYKRPTFEAKLEPGKDPLRINRPARLRGEARYYFGLPVATGEVKWRVTREPIFSGWWFDYYGGYGGHGHGYGGASRGSQVVAQGKSALKPDGSFELDFVPQADERDAPPAAGAGAAAAPAVSYRYQVSADVTDEGGETRSASRSFRLGFTSVEASVRQERSFFVGGEAVKLEVRRTDLDGEPRKGEGRYTLVSLVKPATTLLPADMPLPTPPGKTDNVRTPGDELRPRHDPRYSPEKVLRSWQDGAQQGEGNLTHDAKGLAAVDLGPLRPGAYRLRYQTRDDFGAEYRTEHDLLVADGAAPSTLPLPFLFQVESSSVKVGGTARIWAHTGLGGQPLFLERYRAGKRISRQLLTGGQKLIEIPIGEADRGGFGLVLSTLRDHQLMTGQLSLFVPWDDRELKVAFSTFRDKLRPGAKETWKITVKHQSSKDGTAAVAGAVELLAYMYDRSLDLFTGHHPPSPLSVYPSHTGAAWLQSTLGAASQAYGWASNYVSGWYDLTPTRLQFRASYAIGGPGQRGGRFYRNGAVASPAPTTPAAAAPAAPAGQPAQLAQDATAESRADGKLLSKREAFKSAESADNKPADERQKNKDKSGSDRGEGQGGQAPAVEVRSNFAETAFWKPQVQVNAQGEAEIEFTVPDSVTSWNVWVHALTKDLHAGQLKTEARTVKELLVRPYLPRFLREGDQAEIRVVVNNAADRELGGQLRFDIIDPETQKSVLAEFGLQAGPGQTEVPFTVAKGGGSTHTFRLKAPARVGQVAFRVVATSGDLSDGELRPLPLLPSRMHLTQSRFVTLKNQDRRTLSFPDLARADDPSRINEQMVVTIDAQLFYSVLSALPYLVNYPYECTEQTLNRFVSTGIVSSLFTKYPAVAKVAEQMSKRTTVLETFDGADPNEMALEETPWLVQAKGGTDHGFGMTNVLDPRVAKADREASLGKLRKAQTAIGGFPWFPGGPPSPYITLYLMHGFAKASEFGVEVPRDMVTRGWRYLAQHYRSEYLRLMQKDDCCWEFITFLNYVASAYPDPSWTANALTEKERKEMLDFSFKHWRRHSPYLKGYLALTLKRAGRLDDAKLVWASVMDSSKTTEDQGTFWAPEDRGWLWYNDSIESHAYALRTLLELTPDDSRRHGLVQWLLINKKLGQWKSTRATSEVIYSLLHYLKREGGLGVREEAKVTVGSKQVTFTFEPDTYTGKKNQIIVPGPDLDPRTQSQVVVEKSTPGLAFASATWHFSTEKLPDEDRGDFFKVSRAFFKRTPGPQGFVLTPIGEGDPLKVGDQVEIQVSLTSKHQAEYVHLRAPRAAGLEPEGGVSRWRYDLGIAWYEETRDSANNFFFERLPQGQYTFKYRVRAATAGTFRIGPATVQSMYAPEFAAYSSGTLLKIAP